MIRRLYWTIVKKPYYTISTTFENPEDACPLIHTRDLKYAIRKFESDEGFCKQYVKESYSVILFYTIGTTTKIFRSSNNGNIDRKADSDSYN